MKISEIIQKIKDSSRGVLHGKPCSDDRDKILYGNPDKECTGIVTAVFGSVDVIKKAAERGANLIIVNESIFWNHGDATDWLENNLAFRYKKELLDKYEITVWRFHEYNRAGILQDGRFIDPVNYGFCKKMNWEERIVKGPKGMDDEVYSMWLVLKFEGQKADRLAEEMKEKLDLNGIRIVGDPNTAVYTLYVPPGSIMGYTSFDNMLIQQTEEEGYDCLLGLELVDYTLSEYIRDSAGADRPRAIINVGHFNMEEPGMELVTEWIPQVVKGLEVPVYYANSGDPYEYIL